MHREVQRILSEAQGVEALRLLIDLVRPGSSASAAEAEARLGELIEALRDHEPERASFEAAVRGVLDDSRLVRAFAESGILSDVGFFSELRARVARRLLPPQLHRDDIRRHIRAIFDRGDDWQWIAAVPHVRWAELLSLIVDADDARGHPDRDVLGAVQGLAQRIGASGIDEELNAKLYAVEDYESPFLDLTIQTHDFLEDHRHGRGSEASFERLMDKVRECRDIIVYLRENKSIYGTSLRLTSLSRRILQQLDRLELLAHLVRPQSKADFVDCSVRLFRTLVEATQTANSLGRLVKESADMLAFQITEESARKGQKYITDSRTGYWGFLRAAMQGGAIVAIFAIAKIFIGKLPLSLAAEALLFSLNYAVCFVLLYLTGSILATKQPAVLASAIARKTDEAASRQGALEGVADLIILAWRSQFVSFVGNLICAVPVAWLLAWALEYALGVPVADAAKAASLLASVHPWASGALYYAGVAGIFLFLAGVITGAVENQVVYSSFKQRLADHPALEVLGDGRARLADFVTRNLSMISGNVALGFFLGTAGPLGVILGLPFDIRHIAFSSAHVGVAALSEPELLTAQVAFIAGMGVIGIGFFNFLISFLLTLLTGLESRRVTFGQTRDLIVILLGRLVRRPWEWFVPPRQPRYELPAEISADTSPPIVDPER